MGTVDSPAVLEAMLTAKAWGAAKRHAASPTTTGAHGCD
jgi:hypothetical protein